MARKQRRSTRKQRGGSGYGAYSFTGPAFVTPGGVQVESRAASDYNCGWDLRQPPVVRATGAMMGGSRKQRGGGCGCGSRQAGGRRSRKQSGRKQSGRKQRGGGGGTGGYGFNLDNSLGKVYDSLSIGPCPATPVASDLGTKPLYQQGGEASYRDAAEIISYPSGWGVGPAGVVSTDSAHYVDPLRYGRHCMGGARRTKRKTRRN